MLNRTTYPIDQQGRIYHVTVTHAEHAIHMGLSYTAAKYLTLDTDEYYDFTMTVPSGYRCHFTYRLISTLRGELAVYKDSVVTGGVTHPIRNRNYESTNTDTVVCKVGGTISDEGTLLDTIGWGSSTPGASGIEQGGSSQDVEYIWPENSVFRFRIISKAAGNVGCFRVNFIMEPMIPEEL